MDRVSDETDQEAQPPSDARLVEAAQRDPRCFAPIYERYADRLFRYIRGQSRSMADTDDILSKVIVAVLQDLDRFDPDRGQFASWIFTIARHQVAAHYRADRRFWRTLSRVVQPLPHAGEDPADAVLRNELSDDVKAILDRLSANDRQVLLLRYAADLSHREIAAVVGISEGAVRVRLNRAQRRFASTVGEADGCQPTEPGVRPTGG